MKPAHGSRCIKIVPEALPLRHEPLCLRLNQSFPCFPAAIDIAQLLSFCVAQQRAGLLGVAPDLGLKRLE